MANFIERLVENCFLRDEIFVCAEVDDPVLSVRTCFETGSLLIAAPWFSYLNDIT